MALKRQQALAPGSSTHAKRVGHLRAIQDKLLIFSLLHVFVHGSIEGTCVGGCFCIRGGKGDVHVPGALSDGRNVPVLVMCGHAPAKLPRMDPTCSADSISRRKKNICACSGSARRMLSAWAVSAMVCRWWDGRRKSAGTWCICQNLIYIIVKLSMLASIMDGMARN
jgi:hypothetical protein